MTPTEVFFLSLGMLSLVVTLCWRVDNLLDTNFSDMIGMVHVRSYISMTLKVNDDHNTFCHISVTFYKTV